MTFHVFTNDVGPYGYSCFCHIKAETEEAARREAISKVRHFAPVRVLVIPERYVQISFVDGSGTSPSGLKIRPGLFTRYGSKIGKRS